MRFYIYGHFLPILRNWVEYWDVMFNFTYLSWGWIITIVILSWGWVITVILRTLWVMRWAILVELSMMSIFELWVILFNCWLLKFFHLYVLWEFWVSLWDSDLAPRASLDGTREGILHKVYWCSLTRYAKPRSPLWLL